MRISDWSSDVCSSDLTSPTKWSRRSDGCAHPLIHLSETPPTTKIAVPRNPTTARSGPKVPRSNRSPSTVKFSIASLRTARANQGRRSEEHTSELQSLMRISYAVFCLKKKNITHNHQLTHK